MAEKNFGQPEGLCPHGNPAGSCPICLEKNAVVHAIEAKTIK